MDGSIIAATAPVGMKVERPGSTTGSVYSATDINRIRDAGVIIEKIGRVCFLEGWKSKGEKRGSKKLGRLGGR